MLRALVGLLLLANLAFYVWTLGWLDDIVGVRAIGDREPERLQRQVRPETVRLLPAGAPASAASTPSACLEAGPFGATELAAAQTALQAALPGAGWVTARAVSPGQWLVYLGRFATRDALARKEEEIKRRKLPYEEIRDDAALAPGLSLGRFGDRAAAAQALEQFVRQGVRSARVVEGPAAASGQLLRVEQADATQAARLLALKGNALGKGFAACGSGGA